MAKFKPRARALDLLGRQQIAGVPTALNELFKNAYDAYADHVEVDFFRSHDLLVLRDDGIGMTKEDFESRWLTIGTESKLETTSGISKPAKDNKKSPRAVMGEKGVGRLAIAALGPQVLVLTRARREHDLGEYILAFINWTMFVLPGIDLDEIEIPLKAYKSLDEINSSEVYNLVRIVQNNLTNLKEKTDTHIYEKITKELSSFEFNPEVFSLQQGPSIDDGGTSFIIQPVDEYLHADTKEKSNDLASELHQMLCGFSNTTTNSSVPIKTAFRDHKTNGDTENLISDKKFFTPDDYKKTDHHVSGEFDQYGTFKGELSVYHMDKQYVEFVTDTSGKPLLCGPFKFQLGFLQGNLKDSLLDKQEHTDLAEKLNSMGGVYVYRDNIRILPYGRPDVDFLGIERRRNLRASTYMFNHRRLIGIVELSRENNSMLIEKSGREGFMSNIAYRQFKNILEIFLVKLAQKYFADDEGYAAEYAAKKGLLNNEYEILRRRNKQSSQKKLKLKKALDTYFSKVEKVSSPEDSDTWFDKKINSIVDKTNSKVRKFTENSDLNLVAEDVIYFEGNIINELRDIENELTIVNPRGFGFSKELQKDWLTYEKTQDKIVKPKIKNARVEVTHIISNLAEVSRLHLDSKIRLEQSIMMLKEMEYKKLDKEEKETSTKKINADNIIKKVKQDHKKSKADLELAIDKKIATLKEDVNDSDITLIRTELEDDVKNIANEIAEKYGKIRYALENIISLESSEEISDGQTIQALETRMEALEEEYHENLENIQLGLAIKVVNHEFSSNIKVIRDSIKSLRKWSDANRELKGLHDRIKEGFDYLDNYLNLFTPLEKRMHRRKAVITGNSIYDFIIKLYVDRLKRHDIEILITEAFLTHFLDSYASTIYPVFINLIDNSIYWLCTTNIKPKKILLDAGDDGFIIADNGPGISDRDREYIYDFGYSRKVGGGGMGLYIAKTSLNKDGLDITLSENTSTKGTEFIINKLSGGKDD